MTQISQAMRIRLAGLLGWVILGTALAGAIGYVPTVRLVGAKGLLAMAWAWGIAFAVVMLSGMLVTRAAARGPGRAAFVFIMSALARVVVCLVLAAGVIFLLDIHAPSLLVWVLAFHLVMLAGESIWLAKALQRDAFLVALGEIRRGRAA